ncbi:MAG: hypothetical protein D6707_03540 [Bacteroidetes bacterium]|nr:MAG: hypothetical protein D6707_03540 [Bacteroidota bacterium]
MKKLIIVPLLLLVFLTSEAQLFRGSNYWRKFRNEITIGVGAANCLTDLGGRDQIGSDFIYDLELSTTKWSVSAGHRYWLTRDIAINSALYVGKVAGDDALTNEPFRRTRNLNFQSIIVELSSKAEYHFVKGRTGHRYRLKGARGRTGFFFGIYGFLGVGGFYFDPKGKVPGTNQYVRLKPLSTGGQGLPNGPKPYSSVSVAIPLGLGIRSNIKEFYTVGLEVGWRKTFTDYLDDVSGYYYPNDVIRQEKGDLAATMADPNLMLLGYHNTYASFDQTEVQRPLRGDNTDKDSYMFAQVTFSYKLAKRRRYGGRRIKVRRSMPSF